MSLPACRNERSALCGLGCSALALVLASGCAFGPTHGDVVTSRELDLPVLQATTSLEREARDDGGKMKGEKVTPVLLWTGVALGAVGTVGAIGFGIDGNVAQNQLADVYESGGSQREVDDLIDRGDRDNAIAITAASVAVVGWALAAIVGGIDYSRCGPTARKRAHCRER